MSIDPSSAPPFEPPPTEATKRPVPAKDPSSGGSRRTTDKLVSIVVPCLNEQLCIGEFVDWCKEGLEAAGARGQILIVDSSTDRSPEIAEAHGAEVLRVPKLGLGRAYIDAIPHIRGDYVIMGDCDLTYDFRQVAPFVMEMDRGAEFVMGSRFRGTIEPGAMPALHRHFGTPITTFILNVMYGSRYSDIHCGMRALTLDTLKRIDLQSQSWEYASEMVLKAAKMRLKVAEVPVSFFKDREGRLSHHKRSGWASPWRAGWINLRAMFLYAPDFFLKTPGWIMLAVGLLLTLSLALGPIQLGPLQLNLHWMLLGTTLATLGYSAVQLSVLARVHHPFDEAFVERWRRGLSYNRGMAAAFALFAVGALLDGMLVLHWIRGGMKLEAISYPAVAGLMLIVLGFQTFTFTLLFVMMVAGRKQPAARNG